MPAKIGCPGKKRKAYNATFKRLQAHAQKQKQLLAVVQQQNQDTKNLHLLLADGICQQKLLYELFLPLHKQWLDGVGPSLAQHIMQQGCMWEALVPIVATSNPMLRAMLQVTPAHLQHVCSMSIEEASQMHRDVVGQLVLLLEMLSPQRYQQQLSAEATAEAKADGIYAGPNQIAATAAGDEAAAAQEAYNTHRRRLAEVIEQIRLTVGLLTLHRPLLLFELGTLNYETMQRSVPPMHHAQQASRRLQLSSWQLQQLRLMLRRYNRAIQAQQRRGITLLGMSENSPSLQTIQAVKQQSAAPTAQLLGSSLLHHPSALAAASSLPAMEPATVIVATAAAVSAATAAAESQGSAFSMDASSGSSMSKGGAALSGQRRSISSGCKQEQQQQQEEEAADEPDTGDDLEQQLQQHLHSRLELSQLMGFWVLNTLTDLQIAQFIVYAWPWYPMCPVLAASSVLMSPVDNAPPSGNGVAADAELLAVQQQVWQRGAGMEQQLEWVLQHCTGQIPQ